MHKRKNTKVILSAVIGVILVAVLVAVGNTKLFKGAIVAIQERGTAVQAVAAIAVHYQYNPKTSLPESGPITLIDFTATAPINQDIYFDRFFVNYAYSGTSKRVEKVSLNVDSVTYWSEQHAVVLDQRGRNLTAANTWLLSGNGQLSVAIRNMDLAVIRAGKSKRFKLVGEVASADRLGVTLAR